MRLVQLISEYGWLFEYMFGDIRDIREFNRFKSRTILKPNETRSSGCFHAVPANLWFL
jgi:hypothetical protein